MPTGGAGLNGYLRLRTSPGPRLVEGFPPRPPPARIDFLVRRAGLGLYRDLDCFLRDFFLAMTGWVSSLGSPRSTRLRDETVRALCPWIQRFHTRHQLSENAAFDFKHRAMWCNDTGIVVPRLWIS
jgi:hypothetical protein